MMLKNAVQNVAQSTVTPRTVHQSGHFSDDEDTVAPRTAGPICGAARSMEDALKLVCPVA